MERKGRGKRRGQSGWKRWRKGRKEERREKQKVLRTIILPKTKSSIDKDTL